MQEISSGVRAVRRCAMAVLVTAMLAWGCASKMVVHPATAGDLPKGQGLFYALPKTVLLFQVPVTATEKKRGELADVTRYFFPFATSAEISADSTSYSLGTPTLSAFGVPDSEHVYMVDVRGGRFEDKKLNMTFGEDGVLQKYEAESYSQTAEFITQIIKSGTGIASKALSGGAMSSPVTPAAQDPTCTAVAGPFDQPFERTLIEECLGMPLALRFGLSEYVDHPSSDSLVVKQARATRFGRAWRTFQRINEVQAHRASVLNAQNVPPGQSPTYTEILKVIDNEIDQLMGEFFGTMQRKTYWTALYEVTPVGFAAGTESVTLFQFSAANGICGTGASSGTPELALREPLSPPARSTTCEKPIDVVVRVRRPANQFGDVVQAALSPQPTGERGLFYRVPGKAFVTIVTEQDQEPTPAVPRTGVASLPQQDVRQDARQPATARPRRVADVAHFAPAVAQFGAVASLPPTTGGRKTQYAADLFSATGALRSFVLGSESVIETSMAADVGAGATEVIGGLQSRRAARDERDATLTATNDELALLKRQADILEAQLRIKKAEEALDMAIPNPPPD